MRLLTIALCVCALSICFAVQTGLKSTISETGLTYAKDVGLKILLQQLSTINLPDISGAAGTPIGDIDYNLTDIVLNGLTIPSASITIMAGQGVNVDISSVSAHVHMNWHYREHAWPHVSDGGSADINISGTTISVTVVVGENAGRPTVTTGACSVNVGHLDIDLHGGASWLYSLFTGLFSGQIRDAVTKGLHDGVTNAINQQAEQAIATIPIEEPIDHVSEINFELTAVPYFTSTYLTTQHLGEFYALKNPSEAPFTAAALPDTLTSDMVQFFVSDYTVNSAGYVYYQAGQLTVDVSASDIPPSSPVQLNTTDFQDMVPNLYAAYPDMLMHLTVSSSDLPQASFDTSGSRVVAPGVCEVNVVLPNGTLVNAFDLALVALLNATVGVSGTSLVGELGFLNTTLSLKSTNIGQFDVSTLQTVMDLLCQMYVLPLLNKSAQRGFPLPIVDGITFVTPKIIFGQDFVLVSTDVSYNP